MTTGRRRIIVFDDELERLVAEKMQRTGSTNWAGTLKAAARRNLLQEETARLIRESGMRFETIHLEEKEAPQKLQKPAK